MNRIYITGNASSNHDGQYYVAQVGMGYPKQQPYATYFSKLSGQCWIALSMRHHDLLHEHNIEYSVEFIRRKTAGWDLFIVVKDDLDAMMAKIVLSK